MKRIHHGAIGKLNISASEVHIDNKARNRSGHMSHAMVEYAPGKIIAFNSNCSPKRCGGHSAFGWVEYKYSSDGGKTWSQSYELPFSKEILLDGVNSISIEKAVWLDGVLTCFAVCNTQGREVCCEPWEDAPLVIQSYDIGKTWEKPVVFSAYPGRIYDAAVKDGIIYAVETCDKDFISDITENRFRLFTSSDNGKTFQEKSIIDIDSYHRGYAAMQFLADGTLAVYTCDLDTSYYLDLSLSYDNGATWKKQEHIRLKSGMRNVQIAPLGKGYVMHGRAWLNELWGCGQVIYTSKDGINWDDGIVLEPKKTACYYSNMLPLKDENGKDYVILQYSDLYADDARVNVMHRILTVE